MLLDIPRGRAKREKWRSIGASKQASEQGRHIIFFHKVFRCRWCWIGTDILRRRRIYIYHTVTPPGGRSICQQRYPLFCLIFDNSFQTSRLPDFQTQEARQSKSFTPYFKRVSPCSHVSLTACVIMSSPLTKGEVIVVVRLVVTVSSGDGVAGGRAG